MTLGKKLQLLRKARGMSQEQLAEALGLSRQAVSKWELDAALPDTANVVALSRLFGVTTDYLLVEEGAEPKGAGEAITHDEPPREGPVKINWYICRFYGGLMLLLMGIIGIFAVFVVSRFMPVPIPYVTESGGEIWYTYDTNMTDISFKHFVDQYKLDSLLIMLAVMAVIGVLLLIWDRLGPWLIRFRDSHKDWY